MQRSRLLLPLAGSLLALSFVVSGPRALAATPEFTISATNVTMSSSGSNGSGLSTFTLTSVNGYVGTVAVDCFAPTIPSGVKVPYCGAGPVARAFPLTANEAVTGNENFTNEALPLTVSSSEGNGYRLGQGLALAGLLLWGFGLRRRAARWLTVAVFAAGTLAGLAGISACGGSNSVVTPGTYEYTLKAIDINTNAAVTTTVSVTVP